MVTLQAFGFGTLTANVINLAKGFAKSKSTPTQAGDIFPFLTKDQSSPEEAEAQINDTMEMMAERPT